MKSSRWVCLRLCLQSIIVYVTRVGEVIWGKGSLQRECVFVLRPTRRKDNSMAGVSREERGYFGKGKCSSWRVVWSPYLKSLTSSNPEGNHRLNHRITDRQNHRHHNRIAYCLFRPCAGGGIRISNDMTSACRAQCSAAGV